MTVSSQPRWNPFGAPAASLSPHTLPPSLPRSLPPKERCCSRGGGACVSQGRPPVSCPFMARCCASTPRLPDGLFRAESGCWLSLFIFPVQEFGCAPVVYKPDYSMMKTTVARNKSCWDKHAVDCSALVRPPPSGFPSLEAAPAPGSCSLRYLNRPLPIRPQPQLKERGCVDRSRQPSALFQRLVCCAGEYSVLVDRC